MTKQRISIELEVDVWLLQKNLFDWLYKSVDEWNEGGKRPPMRVVAINTEQEVD